MKHLLWTQFLREAPEVEEQLSLVLLNYSRFHRLQNWNISDHVMCISKLSRNMSELLKNVTQAGRQTIEPLDELTKEMERFSQSTTLDETFVKWVFRVANRKNN